MEWERWGYTQGLSRAEIEAMSLREYILRRQADLRGTVETLKVETLPVVNALSRDPVTLEDLMGVPKSRDDEDLKAFRYEVATQTDLVDDWSLVDPDLDDQPDAE